LSLCSWPPFGKRAGIPKPQCRLRGAQRRILVRLAAIDSAAAIEALHQPGFAFHPLRGRPGRCSIRVNGPWCITFEWRDGGAPRVDLEQYH
jgi:toxin HigB-1